MTARLRFLIAVCAGLAVAGVVGCASSKSLADEGPRYYAAALPVAVEAVAQAFADARLNIEDHGWLEENATYVFTGNAQERVFASSESVVQTATVTVRLERVTPDVTRVIVESTQEAVPSMASSSGRTMDYRRRFLAQLDKRLTRMTSETLPTDSL
ncbi:MAG: hypothetical protein R2834_13390 [Rhodothermales bacterium]